MPEEITDQYGAPDLEFAGRKIAVECELLPGEAEAAVKNYLAQNNPGSAEVAVVISAVKKLYVNEEVINLRANKPFPRIRDEDGTSLLEFLLGYIVDHERWLATKFAPVFARYLDQQAAQESNPTKPLRGTEKQAS